MVCPACNADGRACELCGAVTAEPTIPCEAPTVPAPSLGAWDVEIVRLDSPRVPLVIVMPDADE
jgi:hypothetical protein